MKKASPFRVYAWCLVLGPVLACTASPDQSNPPDSGGSANNAVSSGTGIRSSSGGGNSSGSTTSGSATSGSATTSPSSGSAAAGSTTGGTEDAGGAETGATVDGGDSSIAEGGSDVSAALDSGQAADADGGDPMCKTKLCVDPVFDCPLQGCWNGCTNFFCN